jgi:hypothetical protein
LCGGAAANVIGTVRITTDDYGGNAASSLGGSAGMAIKRLSDAAGCRSRQLHDL